MDTLQSRMAKLSHYLEVIPISVKKRDCLIKLYFNSSVLKAAYFLFLISTYL